MRRILLLIFTILSLTKGTGQCILSLRNCSDSTITVNIERLGITHTLTPKEIYTCSKVISSLQKYETYEVIYDGITTTNIGMPDSTKYTKGRYELSFSYDPRVRVWNASIGELRAKRNYK